MPEPLDNEPPERLTFTWTQDGDEGVSQQAIADFLKCTPAAVGRALQEVEADPIGRGIMFNKEFPVYDWRLIDQLRQLPVIDESIQRCAKRVTSKKRERFLMEYVSTWDVESASLVGIREFNHKSIGDVTIELGGCTVLIGPNGSGKTNILEAVAIAGDEASVLERLRPGARDPAGQQALSVWYGYRLDSGSPQDLETFLGRFVRGRAIDGPYLEHLRTLLTELLTNPTVWIFPYRLESGEHGQITFLGSETSATAEIVALSKLLQGLEGPKDSWIIELVSRVAELADGPTLLAQLPELAFPEPQVEVVDGDPTRLVADLISQIPDLADSLWHDFRPEASIHEFVFELGMEGLTLDDESGTEPSGVPWVTWLDVEDPSIEGRDALLAECRAEDPRVALAAPRADREWIAWGTGEASLANVEDVVSVSDRRASLELLQSAAASYLFWTITGDGETLEKRESSSEAAAFRLHLEDYHRALGFVLPGASHTRWLQGSLAGAVVPTHITATLLLIESLANGLVPRFVQEQGRILASLLPPETWPDGEPALGVSFAGPASKMLKLHETGRGVQRWIAASVREAVRRLQASSLEPTCDIDASRAEDPSELVGMVRVVESDSTVEPSILLVDEPEMSLHPEAQEQVAAWCVEASKLGQSVIVATHAPAMLDLPAGDATVVVVTMDRGKRGVNPIEFAALAGLEHIGDMIGLGRSGLLQLTRGFIIVEGRADVQVLEALLGETLRTQRVVPIPLHGTLRHKGMIQPEFLAAVGKPMTIMFDEIRLEVIQGRREPASQEEEILDRLLRTFCDRYPEVGAVSFEAPDVICALPDDAVRRADPSFKGWDALLKTWDPTSGNFKMHTLDSLGLPKEHQEIDRLIDSVLGTALPTDVLPRVFARTASELRAWAESIAGNEWLTSRKDPHR